MPTVCHALYQINGDQQISKEKSLVFKTYWIFILVLFICHLCVYAHVTAVLMETRRGSQIPWS